MKQYTVHNSGHIDYKGKKGRQGARRGGLRCTSQVLTWRLDVDDEARPNVVEHERAVVATGVVRVVKAAIVKGERKVVRRGHTGSCCVVNGGGRD